MSSEVQLDAKPVVGIVGMACRFPGARNVDELWSLLRTGAEGIARVTDAELRDRGVPEQVSASHRYVRAIGRLEDIDKFDAGFFEFTPRQAAELDPQHRLFLECAWEALEDAGCDPARFTGSIGVFAGAGPARYALEHIGADLRNHRLLELIQHTLGTDKDFLSTRVSYKLNLRGPSLTIQTACSTSLVAVHMACQSLLSGDCDLALAGGVCIPIPHGSGYLYNEGGILSPDGHCRAFDAQGKGTVPSAGVGIVVLCRIEDAVAARHHVYAAIRNSAVNNDGHAKVGFTAPSVEGQRDVLETALAGTDPGTIGMIEAHGTGTVLGDSVELTALTEVFANAGVAPRACALGSIKTNIGHPDAAAGVAGLIKAALCLDAGQLVPSLHFSEPNELLKSSRSPFFVNTEARAWATRETPRRAGVSSFGMGGTNAHVVLEEVPERPAAPAQQSRARLFVLSAKSANALAQARARLALFLREHPHVALDDIAYTLQTGRRNFEYRSAAVAATRDELIALLEQPLVAEARAASAPGEIILHIDPVLPTRDAATDAACSDDPQWVTEYADLLAKFAIAARAKPMQAATSWEQVAAQLCNVRMLLRHGVAPSALLASGAGVLMAAHLAEALHSEDYVRLMVALSGECRTDPVAFASLMQATAIARPRLRLVHGADGAEISVQSLRDPRLWSTAFDAKTGALATGVAAASFVVPCSATGLTRWCSGQSAGRGDRPNPGLLQQAIGDLWMKGVRIDWRAASAAAPGCLTRLPTYPFERSLYWLDDEAYEVRAADNAAPALYLPSWRTAPTVQATDSPSGHVDGAWVVVAEADGLADATAEHLRLSGQQIVRVALTDQAEVRGFDFTIPVRDSSRAAAHMEHLWRQLRERGTAVSHIVYIVPQDSDRDAAASMKGYASSLSVGYLAVLQLIWTATQFRPPSALGVGVVTRRLSADLQLVTAPFLEVLTSLPTVLRQELPYVHAKIIDLLPSAALQVPDPQLQVDARQLVSELRQPHGNPIVAYRSGRRLLWEFDALEQTATPSAAPSRLRARGVYVITGGLGAIGRELAMALASRYGARLLLIGRRGVPARSEWAAILASAGSHPDTRADAIRSIQAMEAQGARVVVAAADVADEASLREAVDCAERELGPVNGVFHLAAALEAISAQSSGKLTAAQLEGQAHAKLGGMLALEKVFAGRSLDCAVLFSSVSVFLGGIGLAAYAAANAAMDGLARTGRRCGSIEWLSINWDAWAQGAKTEHLPHELTPQEGVSAFMDALCHCGIAQLVVSKSPFRAGLPAARSVHSSDRSAATAEPGAIVLTAPDAGASPQQPGGELSDLEQQITTIWQEKLGRSPIGLDDDLFDLDGDSLVMLGISAQVEELLQVEVPLRDFFRGGRTVRGLCELIRARLADVREVGRAPANNLPDRVSGRHVATAAIASRNEVER